MSTITRCFVFAVLTLGYGCGSSSSGNDSDSQTSPLGGKKGGLFSGTLGSLGAKQSIDMKMGAVTKPAPTTNSFPITKPMQLPQSMPQPMGGSGGGDACESCLTDACESELYACRDGTDCGNFFACFNACASGDSACGQSCARRYPAAQTPATEVASCAQASCASECGLETDDTGSEGLDCGGCVADACGAEQRHCMSNTSCVSLVDCISRCSDGDDTCVDVCAERYPQGVDPLLSVIECGNDSCSDNCDSSSSSS